MAKPSITKFEPVKNYLLIEIGWNNSIIVPYEDGMTLLASMKSAEVLEYKHDNEKIKIVCIKSDFFKVSVISEQERNGIKTAQLMGVSYKEFLDAQQSTTSSSA